MDDSRKRRQYAAGGIVVHEREILQGVLRNRFSVTLEANDIFNKGNRNATLLNKDVTVYRCNTNNNRTFMLTLQYSFNSTRDRYRGQGAGTNEMNRF